MLGRTTPIPTATQPATSAPLARIVLTVVALLLAQLLLFAVYGQTGASRCRFDGLGDARALLQQGSVLALPAQLDGAIPAPCAPGEPMYLVYLSESDDAPGFQLPDGVVAVNALADPPPDDAATAALVDWFWTIATTPRSDVVNAAGGFSPVFIAEGRAFLMVQRR